MPFSRLIVALIRPSSIGIIVSVSGTVTVLPAILSLLISLAVRARVIIPGIIAIPGRPLTIISVSALLVVPVPTVLLVVPVPTVLPVAAVLRAALLVVPIPAVLPVAAVLRAALLVVPIPTVLPVAAVPPGPPCW